MPLLDSFRVDHTKMPAPAVRVAKTMKTKRGDTITVYDLRFCRPNREQITEKAIHTMEHLFAGFIRENLKDKDIEIIDCSPMGCRTGFYMSAIGEPIEDDIRKAWKKSMEDILEVKDQNNIPELNDFQCGTRKMHSLEEAQEMAKKILSKEIGIMNNHELTLSEEKLKAIEESK